MASYTAVNAGREGERWLEQAGRAHRVKSTVEQNQRAAIPLNPVDGSYAE
ncbi:hypothetical protein PHLCEN_2v6921 [Hermanssonia centrifuga]|uniref:Uncharacterized protein n=1 Tax=Hermanssonia centrifuga TaxID=98765 RepID=A0A2R6NXX9_9APHY|nr:hypothetical protein PHLCEN_2v6921 [Hermanssonia centrifuga]